MKSAFDPKTHEQLSDNKLFTALYSFSDIFRVLFWRLSKETGLSPLQIQILLFIATHPQEIAKVTYLANEFNMSKATISDAVKTLLTKDYLTKQNDPSDQRSFSLLLTKTGKQIAQSVDSSYQPILKSLAAIDNQTKTDLYSQIMALIAKLNQSGIALGQRMCFNCAHYQAKTDQQFYCNFLDQLLDQAKLRIDCEEHEVVG